MLKYIHIGGFFMTPQIIALIVNLSLLLFVVIGFLMGLKRGLKKQAMWCGFFALAVILSFIFTPLITKGIINIKFGSQSLRDMLLSFITGNEVVDGLYVEGSAFASAVDNLPIMIANLAVFIIVLYLFIFLLWIVYMIVASIVFSKKRQNKNIQGKVYTIKAGQAVELIDQPVKKHRLLGSLIGVLQGFMLCFFTLLPISGVVGIYMDASQTKVVYAEETTNQTAVQELLNSVVPANIQSYIKAYDGTIINKVGGVIGFDNLCFNGIAKTTINGESVKLRNEIQTFAQIYDSVEFLFDLDFNNLDYKSLNFEKLNKTVDLLFDSTLFRNLSAEIIPYALDYVTTNDLVEGNEIKDICLALKVGFEDEDSISALKTELKSVLNVAETLCTSGIVNELTSSEIDTNKILDILVAEDCKNLNKIINNVLSSTTVKNLLVGTLNVGLNMLETSFANPCELDRIKVENVQWNSVKNDVTTIASSFAEIYEIISIEFESKSLLEKVYEVDYVTLLDNIGSELDTLKNTTLFTTSVNETNIYDNLLTAFQGEEIGTYLNLLEIKSDKNFNFSTQLSNVKNLLTQAKPIALNTQTFEEFNYTNIKQSINILTNSDLAKLVKIEALDKLDDSVNDIENLEFKTLVSDILTDAQSKNSISALSSDISSFLDILEICGKSGLLDQLKNNNIDVMSVIRNLDEEVGNKKQYEILIEKLVSTPILKKTLINLTNILVDTLESSLSDEDSPLTLARVIQQDADWTGWTELESKLKTIFEELVCIALTYEDEQKFELTTDILDDRFISCLTNIGTMLDNFATLSLWQVGEDNIYDQTITALADKDLGEYINFNSAKLDNFNNNEFWKPELEAYKTSLERMIEKKISTPDGEITLLKALLDGYDTESIIKILTTEDTLGETPIINDVDTILTPILERDLLKKVAVMVLNEVNFQIEKITNSDITKETMTLPKVTLETNISVQSTDILSVIKEAVKALNLENPEIRDYKPLLNAMQTNYETVYGTSDEGVFKQAYILLENYINSELKEEIASNFGINANTLKNVANIPLDTLIDVADTATTVIEKISNNTATAEDINALVDELKSDEVQELVEVVASNGGSITISNDLKTEVAEHIAELVSNGEIDADLQSQLKGILGITA